MNTPEPEGIAIIGMAGRFPGAPNLDAFWRILQQGKESGHVESSPRSDEARDTLAETDAFDAAVFGISDDEAQAMHPQLRMHLEECWTALEDAGCDPRKPDATVGIFVGSDQVLGRPTGGAMAHQEIAAGSAYHLDLRGPAIDLATGPSASLVAVHQAVQALLTYACDLALASGVSVGHGSPGGVGVVVLKRLSEARTNEDSIRAIIRGSAINHDGRIKKDFASVNPSAQAEVAVLAHALAGVPARSVQLLEIIGAGLSGQTEVELSGLTQAFAAESGETNFCALSSTWQVFGDLGAAGGIAGLIKVVLALRHAQIPSECADSRNAATLAATPFFLTERPSEWRREAGPRRAGIHALGMGGTNAHVVVEEAPELPPSSHSSDRAQIVVLSGPDDRVLEQRTAGLADYLEAEPQLDLAGVARTLQTGRTHFPHRRAYLCSSRELAISALRGSEPNRTIAGIAGTPGVAFLFSDRGNEYLGMGAQLLERWTAFREAFEQCRKVLLPQFDLRTVVIGSQNTVHRGREILREPRVAIPALFAISYAIARLWQSWGLHPSACVGIGIGEYAAATIAGAMSLEDGLRLACSRAAIEQEQPRTVALTVGLGEADVQFFLQSGVTVAKIASPSEVVLTGAPHAVARVEDELQAVGTSVRRLTSQEFPPPPLPREVLGPLATTLSAIRFEPPKIRLLAARTGQWLDRVDADYWLRHAETTESNATPTTPRSGPLEPWTVSVECGPGQSNLEKVAPTLARDVLALPSIRDGMEDESSMQTALAHLWVRGAEIQWEAVHPFVPAKVSLPTYPFQRRNFSKPPSSVGKPVAEPVAASPTQSDGLNGKPEMSIVDATNHLAAQLGSSSPATVVTLVNAMNDAAAARHLPFLWTADVGLIRLTRGSLREAELIFAHLRLRGHHDWARWPIVPFRTDGMVGPFEESLEALLSAGLLTRTPPTRTSQLPPPVAPPRRLPEDFDAEGNAVSPAPVESTPAARPVAPVATEESIPPTSLAPAQPDSASSGKRVEEELTAAPIDTPPVPVIAPAKPKLAPVDEIQQKVLAIAFLGNEANAALNVSACIELIGPLELSSLETAFWQLVRRHECLRTTFSPSMHQRVIHWDPPLAWNHQDFSELSESEREQAIRELTSQGGAAAFDLREGPLCRATIVTLHSDRHELHFAAHAAVCDRGTIAMFIHELAWDPLESTCRHASLSIL